MILYTPQNQQKLTNVAVVRYKKAGIKFEIACYKNKLQDYRNNPSTDLSEVLQSDSIFSNVSKGLVAKNEDLKKAFGNTFNPTLVIKEILEKGEGHVGSVERSHILETLRKDISVIIAEKTINPETLRPYTASMIERVLSQDLHVSIKPDDSAKQQALEIIKYLEQSNKFPIAKKERN